MEEEYDNYEMDLFKLSPNLRKYFDEKSIIKPDFQTNWEPPKTYGLTNAEEIIPRFYIRDYQKIVEKDYFGIIIDKIRNFKKLNKREFDYTLTLEGEEKRILLEEFHKLIKVINDLVDNID